MYEYRAALIATHDGDTITVMLDQGLKEFRKMNIRLAGINAPELSTAAGHPARDHLIGLLGNASLVIRTLRDAADKYGERWEGRIWLESAGTWTPDNTFLVTTPSINETMIADGFAVPYL